MAVQGRPIAVSMVGDASRYSAYKLVDSVGSADLIKALERGWGRMLLGPMERLKAEEGKGFCSQQFAAWAQGHDIGPGPKKTVTCAPASCGRENAK